jgi:hypothetical protein
MPAQAVGRGSRREMQVGWGFVTGLGHIRTASPRGRLARSPLARGRRGSGYMTSEFSIRGRAECPASMERKMDLCRTHDNAASLHGSYARDDEVSGVGCGRPGAVSKADRPRGRRHRPRQGSLKPGSFTQRYVKRHGCGRRSGMIPENRRKYQSHAAKLNLSEEPLRIDFSLCSRAFRGVRAGSPRNCWCGRLPAASHQVCQTEVVAVDL